eukprot:1149808-Rhodomonas_salina.1
MTWRGLTPGGITASGGSTGTCHDRSSGRSKESGGSTGTCDNRVEGGLVRAEGRVRFPGTRDAGEGLKESTESRDCMESW